MTTNELVDKIKAEAPKVTLKCEPLGIDTERFIVEGDIGLKPSQVLGTQRSESRSPSGRRGETKACESKAC